MRREDLGLRADGPTTVRGAETPPLAWRPEQPAAAPPTLEEALRVPDLGDGEIVRTLWDDLVGAPAVVEAPVTAPAGEPPTGPVAPVAPGAEPAPEPVLEPAAPARREARRARRDAKDQRKLERLKLRRHRILPRTVLGISSMLLFFGLGVGLAGAVLYAYYDWRLSENEQRVGELSESLERRLRAANEELAVSSENAVQTIRAEARPLRDLLEQEATVNDLTGRLAGSVWFVETLDEDGVAAAGSAFVAASDDARSLLVTSFSTVAAGTTEPAPTITLRSGEETLEAELYNWDPDNDLALLILPRGGLTPLPWAEDDSLAQLIGERVYAVEGIGGNGVSLSPGSVIDQSDVGIQHTAALNQAFRGGPIVNGRGEVVAIASTSYAPLNYATGDVSFGVPVQAACERVLSCSGDVPGAGDDG